MFNVPHAKTKEFKECFDELGQIWTDPRQLAGTVLFCSLLSGRQALPGGAIWAEVNWNKVDRRLLAAQGYTAEQIEQVMAQPGENREEVAKELYDKNWKEDAAGTAKRVLETNRAIAASGEALSYTGAISVTSEGKQIGGVLQGAFKKEWNALASKGQLPSVERNEDGSFHIRKIDGVTKQTVFEADMQEAEADAYLRMEIGKQEDKQRQENRKK